MSHLFLWILKTQCSDRTWVFLEFWFLSFQKCPRGKQSYTFPLQLCKLIPPLKGYIYYSLYARIWGEKYFIEHIENESNSSNDTFHFGMLNQWVPGWVAFTSNRLHIHTQFVNKLYCTSLDLPALPWHYNFVAAFPEWPLWTVLSALHACVHLTFTIAPWAYPHFADEGVTECGSSVVLPRKDIVRCQIQPCGLPNSDSALLHYFYVEAKYDYYL